MPLRYANLMSQVTAAVDDVFGERLRIEPRTRGTSRNLPGPDPDRAAVTVTGVLRSRDALVDRGASQGGAWEGEMPGDKAMVYIRTDKAPAYHITDGDRVVCLDRPATPAYEVASVHRDGTARLALHVTPLSTS